MKGKFTYNVDYLPLKELIKTMLNFFIQNIIAKMEKKRDKQTLEKGGRNERNC